MQEISVLSLPDRYAKKLKNLLRQIKNLPNDDELSFKQLQILIEIFASHNRKFAPKALLSNPEQGDAIVAIITHMKLGSDDCFTMLNMQAIFELSAIADQLLAVIVASVAEEGPLTGEKFNVLQAQVIKSTNGGISASLANLMNKHGLFTQYWSGSTSSNPLTAGFSGCDDSLNNMEKGHLGDTILGYLI